MSNYITLAKRKMSELDYEKVTMLDDYFGKHQYGVQFPNGEILHERETEVLNPNHITDDLMILLK